ncbi:MAG: Gfo/Idh/MocA family protein [Armatimonadota bacterium]
MAQCGLGIIGVGGFGLFSLEEYRRLPEIRITAIAGTKPEKYAALAKQYEIPFHTTDWRALVTHPEVDIVYLATPPDTRTEMALAALEAGKHVFCEKPLALSLAEADRMLAAAERAGLRVGINFVMRYSRIYETIRSLVAERIFGEPQRFVFENHAGDLPASHWFWDPRRSGGILVEHGVHFFDIANTIFGEGRLHWAVMSRRESGEADRWWCALRYGERMYASFYHAFDKPSAIEHTRGTIECAQGALTIDGWFPTQLVVDGLLAPSVLERARELLPSAEVVQLPAPQMVLADGRQREVTHSLKANVAIGNKEEAYAVAVGEAMRDFAAWARDAAHPPRVTGADGRAALAIALEAREMALRNATDETPQG